MPLRARLYRLWMKRRPKSLSATKIIAVAFGLIILTGALLLNLPAASRNGISAGFLPALFTATSATCVTGLSLFDTWSQWSGFGQIVLLLSSQKYSYPHSASGFSFLSNPLNPLPGMLPVQDMGCRPDQDF